MTDLFEIDQSPITEPESLVIGTFAQWRRLLDYDDSLYSVYYQIQDGTHGHDLILNGTYDTVNEWWAFTLGASGYGNLHSGQVRWDLNVQRNSDSERVILESGLMILHETTDDRRTHAEIMVAKIESVLQGRADHDIESYSIKNRSLTRMSVKELMHWRDYYRAEVDYTGGSDTGAKRVKKNTVRVRFI